MRSKEELFSSAVADADAAKGKRKPKRSPQEMFDVQVERVLQELENLGDHRAIVKREQKDALLVLLFETVKTQVGRLRLGRERFQMSSLEYEVPRADVFIGERSRRDDEAGERDDVPEENRP
jgi:hypothetical protein